MEVSDVMTTDVVIAHEDTSVADLADILTTHHVSAVPVVDSDRVVGVVSQADLLPRVRSARPVGRRRSRRRGTAKAAATSARELMSTPALTVAPDAPLFRGRAEDAGQERQAAPGHRRR